MSVEANRKVAGRCDGDMVDREKLAMPRKRDFDERPRQRISEGREH
jgi:hypothetical protein